MLRGPAQPTVRATSRLPWPAWLLVACGDDGAASSASGSTGSTGGGETTSTAASADTTAVGSSSSAGDTTGGKLDEPEWPHLECDPLVPEHCGLPFPNNVFSVVDDTTPSGRRLAFASAALPRPNSGAMADPAAFNERDGFSVSGTLLAYLPGATTAGFADPLHIGDSLSADSPTVLLDATTGERVAHFAELDVHADDEDRALMIQPAASLAYGHRYIVAVRRVVDADGVPVPSSPAFAALRDGTASDEPSVEDRRALYGDIFARLAEVDVARDELQLAWDFTVSSREHTNGRALHMRDVALEMVGDAGPNYTIMVTTTDVGHPLCTDVGAPARRGAPVRDGCNSRIASFTDGAIDVQSACTDVCPVDVLPTDPFVHFDIAGTNVPDGTPAQALSCLGPQGIHGCAYASPLEAMLLALDPTACWNDPTQPGCADDPQWGDKPFLRDEAALAIIIISDGTECSVDAPGGETYFTDDDVYWEIHPDAGTSAPSPAVCWNAGVACEGPDETGAWSGCMSIDNPVLHPTDRYVDALRDLDEVSGRYVWMIGVLGVPEVTAHNPASPFEPTAGGVDALLERAWTEADLTQAELDDGVTIAHKVWEFGNIAPGCANERGTARFPNRVGEVCASRDVPDDPSTPDFDESVTRCCVESLCDDDYTAAIKCLVQPLSVLEASRPTRRG